MQIAPIDLWLIVIYIAIVIALGLWSARKQSPKQYLIHGRNLNAWQFTASTCASWINGSTIIAGAAFAFQYGISVLMANFGTIIGMLLFTRYALELRQKAHDHQFLTVSDYFYHVIGKKAGVASAVLLSVVITFLILSNLIAGSSVLANLAGWSYGQSLVISAVVVLIYLLLGGMKSVVKTDIFQYFMIVILTVVVSLAMVKQTGIDTTLLSFKKASPGLMVAFVIFGIAGPFYSAHTWQRLYAVKDDRSLKIGLLGAGGCIFVVGVAITLIGIAAYSGFPETLPEEAAVFGMAQLLPTGLLGLGLAMLFAAIMSSIDTQVFYLSSSIAKDYLGHLLGKMSEEQIYQNTRIFIVVIIFITTAFAYIYRDLIDILLAFVGLSIALVPPIVASFHMKLNDGVVATSIAATGIYVIVLLIVGKMSPELSVGSIAISGLVLLIGQLCVKVFSR